MASLLSSVALLNLFVGVLSTNYERREANSTALFVRHRAMSLASWHARPWARCLFAHANARRKEGELWCVTQAKADKSEPELPSDVLSAIAGVVRAELEQTLPGHLERAQQALLAESIEALQRVVDEARSSAHERITSL